MKLKVIVIESTSDTEPKVTFPSLIKMVEENEDGVIVFDLGIYFKSLNRDELGVHWAYLVDTDMGVILNGKYNSQIPALS